MGWYSDLLGTLRSSFKIGKVTFDASSVASVRNITIPDAAGQMALTAISDATTVLCGDGVYRAFTTSALTGTYLSSGGNVVSTGSFNFTVSAVTGVIQGTAYSAAQTNISLSAADATYDRIDVVVLNSSSAIVVLTGTPAALAVTPYVDPTSQLLLATITVSATSTSPSVVNENIYLENTEYTSSTSASHVNAASTSNPFAGTKDIEFTSAVANDYWQGQKGSGTINIGAYNYLVLNIRSKSSWPNQKSLVIGWQLNGAPLGVNIPLKDGVYGFSSSTTSVYQQIVIPVSAFGLNGVSVNQLKLLVNGTGSSIGFYLDNIFLQGGVTVSTNSNALAYQGAWSATFGYSTNDVVYTGNALAGTLILFRAKAANTNVATTVTGTWEQISITRTESKYATIPGTLCAFTGTIRWRPPRPITLSSVSVDMGTAPATGQSAVFNVRKNGTAIFSGTKPTVAAGANTSTPVAATTTLNGTTDYLTVDCEIAAGADAVLRIDYS